MAFLIHILLFLYGLLAVATSWFKTTTVYSLVGDGDLVQKLDTVFPPSVFEPTFRRDPSGQTTDLVPDARKPMAIGAALAAYGLWYLHKHHRTSSTR